MVVGFEEAYRARDKEKGTMAKLYMSELFNGAMRAVSSLLGLVMVALGGVWILQGFNLAFRVGFMVGDKQWAVYGALLALVGLGQIVWSNTREQYYRGR
jgi:drug/metabolite transporter superfamily protein YnfA